MESRDRLVAQVRTRRPDFIQRLSADDAETVLVALVSTPELAPCLAAHTSTVLTILDSCGLDLPVACTEGVDDEDGGA